jgi:NAD(P)H dehydrogenase (quinone)
MPKYAITGASGKLGQLVLRELLAQGVPGGDIAAIVRDPAKQHVPGIQARIADYDEPETLKTALADIDTLLLISASVPGRRVAQHRAIIEAAQTNGVQRIIYTSAVHADISQLILAPEHKETEEILKETGINYTILRNSWYTENYTDRLSTYVEHGVVVHAAKDGLVSGAPRKDYAKATVAALLGTHDNAIYELGGTPFTMADLASAITDVTGTPVTAKAVSTEELVEILKSSGVGAESAAFVAALDEATARNDLLSGTNDLQKLIGETTPLDVAIRESLSK